MGLSSTKRPPDMTTPSSAATMVSSHRRRDDRISYYSRYQEDGQFELPDHGTWCCEISGL